MNCKNGNHSCNSCGEKKCGNKHTTCQSADVAREIGAILSGYNAGNYAEVTLLNKLYELQKKYESESNNGD